MKDISGIGIVYHPTAADISTWRKVAASRQNYKVKKGYKNAFTPKGRTPFEVDYLSVRGELATARILGVQLKDEDLPKGKSHITFTFRDLTVDVHTTSKASDPYLIFNNLQGCKADIFIMVVADYEDASPVRIIGWISRDEFLNSYKARDLGYGERYYVTAAQMHPISELLSSQASHGVTGNAASPAPVPASEQPVAFGGDSPINRIARQLKLSL